MNKVHLIRLLSIISIVLVVVIFLPQFISELKVPGFLFQQNQLISLNSDSITAISLISPTNVTQTFSKDGDSWKINGERADSTMMQKLLAALTDAQINSVAARSEVNYDQLGVSSGSAQQVVITSGTTDSTLVIGKSGSMLNTFYAKKAEEPEVYLVKGSLLNLLGTPISSNVASESGVQSDEAAASAAASVSPSK